MRKPLIATIALLFAACTVSEATATTFCVPNFHATCPNNGTNVAQADIETAMSAQGADGVADTVLVDGVEVTDPGSIDPSGTDPLLVRGVGPASRLTSASNLNSYVLNLAAGGNGRQITMEDLTVVIPSSMPDGGGAAAQISNDVLENVDIESRNPGANALPSWIGGGTYRGGTIHGVMGGTIGNAVRVDANATGPVTVEDATIDHTTSSAIVNSGSVQPLSVRRSRIILPGQSAIVASAGTTNVENTVIETAAQEALYAFANSAANVTINADHITAVATGGNAAGVGVQVANAANGNATAIVSNSIFRGYAAAWLRQAKTASAEGDASLTMRYSNRQITGSEISSGDGGLAVSQGNISADPLFTSSTNFALQVGSPSIDAGDPASGVAEDIVRAPRPRDGDAIAGAIRDQGAYEYQPPDPVDPVDPGPGPVDPGPTDPDPDTTAPDTVKLKGPKARIHKRSALFGFSSEAGATFRCTLDDRPATTCASPLKLRRLKRGKHRFTAAAVDPAGNVDATPATWTFKVIKKRRRR